jgi:aminoglycoside phosphotransferase (APT) family kinase protein
MEAILDNYCELRSVPAARANFFRRAFREIYQGGRPTFTHAAIQKKNIMLDPNDKKITIIDWEFSG